MTTIPLWKDRERRIVNPDLFDKYAEQRAKEFYDEGGKNKNKRSQIRKFYDEINDFKLRLKSLPEDKRAEEFEILLPYLRMLIAKTVYAEGRGLVTAKFKNFIKDGIESIQTPEDLFVFADLFEAIMGFYRQYSDK